MVGQCNDSLASQVPIPEERSRFVTIVVQDDDDLGPIDPP